jgi:hypothetical protein
LSSGSSNPGSSFPRSLRLLLSLRALSRARLRLALLSWARLSCSDSERSLAAGPVMMS